MMLHMRKSIKTRLLLPMLTIMVIQSALFVSLIVFGGLFGKLRSSSIDILHENTENSRLYLEKVLVHRWINNIVSSTAISDELEAVLQEEGKFASDIKTDFELNKKIMSRVTSQMIDLLHRSDATGVFVVLDGPAAAKSAANVKAGVYVQDLDSSSYADDNSDLLMARGLPSIAKSYMIPLGDLWELGFVTEEGNKNSDYYYKPLKSAVDANAASHTASSYGYMGMPLSMSKLAEPVLTYSLPLIAKDGTAIGVVGLDMSVSQIQTYMDAENLNSNGNAICVMGVRSRGDTTIKLAASSGALFRQQFSDENAITYRVESDKETYTVEAKNGEEWYASIQPLEVYNKRSPFEQEEWVIVGMVEKSSLLHFYDQIKRTIGVSMLIPFLFSAIAVFILGEIVTDPIRKLIEELHKKSESGKLSLTRTHINEIDQLAEAVEELNAQVEESSSKISSILEFANVSIGVYEYRGDGTPVFCSRSLYELLGWGKLETLYGYLPPGEFQQRMSVLKEYTQGEEDSIFVIPSNPIKWIRFIRVKQGENHELGVLSDVSSDIVEKRKLERERDYDILTDIYNRRAFREKSIDMITMGQLELAAVIMWDLDNLKYINDTYGHDEGDRYIVAFAKSLRRLEKDGAIISRYSGDEFMTFMYGETDKELIRQRVKAFMMSLQEKTIAVKGGYQIPLRVSGGIAWYPDDGKNFDTLIGYADFAMYMVKHSVKGVVMEFDSETYSDNSYLLAGREELNHLLEAKEVAFAFQPIVTRSGEVYGYELLMRPRLNNLKGITELLNLARAQAKLTQIEVLTWECGLKSFDRQVKAGRVKEGVRIFINSIANVAVGRDILNQWETTFPEYLNRIVIEVTESEPINEETLSIKKEAVKRWNALIALDDYGAGYSSQNALLQVKPDIVKVDMNLIRNVDSDLSRQRMLRSLIAYTKQEGSVVLAEGVETTEELRVLMDMGVDMFQGYYIGCPELEIRPVDPYIIKKIQTI